MSKKRNLLATILLLTLNCWSTVYYVDATGGSDSNTGQLESQAWQSISKVNGNDFNPGDKVLFKRGETWTGESLKMSWSGSKDNNIVFGAYGIGDNPILDARDEIDGWDHAENWRNEGSNAWSMAFSDNPWRLWLSGKEYVAGRQWTKNPNKPIDDTYRWYHSDRLYVFAESNPAQYYNSMIGCHPAENSINISGREYLEFEDLDIRGGKQGSFGIYSSKNISIHDCSIGYGHMGFTIYRGNEYLMIYNNDIDSKADYFYDFEYLHIGDGIQALSMAYSVIRNNKFANWGHSGINLWAGDSGNCVYNKVHDNYFTGEKVSYMRGFECGGAQGQCEYNRFYNNIIINTTKENQMNGNNNYVYNNIIYKMPIGPVAYGTSVGLAFQAFSGGVSKDNKIFNNVIMDMGESCIELLQGDGHQFINNILVNCGTGGGDRHGGNGLRINNPDGNSYINNIFYNPDNQDVINYRGSKITVSQFNEKSGSNDDNMSGNLQADPLLRDPENGNFQLQAASPGISAGAGVTMPGDFDPLPSPLEVGGDIGLFEFDITTTKVEFDIPEVSEAEIGFMTSFNPRMNITFNNPETLNLKSTIQIHDFEGKLIKSFANVTENQVVWNTENYSPGLYIASLVMGKWVCGYKFIFVR